MRRILLAIALAVLFPARASAHLHGGPPTPVGACLYATAVVDGCSGAQAHGSFKQTDLYTLAAQSGQTWTSHHPATWNIAGIDYPVGYDTTLTLKDPKNDAASLPAGCKYLAVGAQNSGPEVLCDRVGTTNATNPTFSGWDFTGSLGGEGCVWLHFGVRTTGTVTVVNSKFQANGQCVTSSGSLMSFAAGTVANNVFAFNDVDGNYPTSVPVSGAMNQMIWLGSTGSAVIIYNYFHNVPARPLAGGQDNSTLVGAYNVFNGYGLDAGGPHGAIDTVIQRAGSSQGSIQWSYNVSIMGSDTAANSVTAPFTFLSAHTPTPWIGVSYQAVKIDHNFSVTNLNGGEVTTSRALSYMAYLKLIGIAVIQDNYVDPTGALGCSDNVASGLSMVGTVDNGSSPAIAGNTLTITSLPNGGVWEGATFHIITGTAGFVDAIVLPYGSTCDGRVSTGNGYTGTYCLAGGAQGPKTFTNGQMQNVPVTTVVYGGSGHDNLNLLDGSSVTISGVQWASGVCNGHG